MTKKKAGKHSSWPDTRSKTSSVCFKARMLRHAAVILAVGGVCVLILGLFTPCAAAKQKPLPTKTVTGAVLDQSNHNVSGASVFLTDLKTRHTDAIYSGADGTYNFSGLNPNDDYQVQAKYKGLASEVRGASSFDTRPRVVINLVLGQPESSEPAGSHTK
ncbi:MAG: carboxypeptidase-like regulatory domain-containing protein [Terriglobia bacterium]